LLERVRTWWFVAVTLLGPILMVALIVVPAVLASTTGKEGVRIRIVDHTGQLGAPLSTVMAKIGWKAEIVDVDTPEVTLLHAIRDDQIDGFLTIPASVLAEAPAARGSVIYQGDNATNQIVVLTLNQLVNQAVLTVRFEDLVAPERLAAMITPVGFSPRHTTGETSGTSGGAVFIVGYAVMMLLYLAIALYAVNVMRSVVQEKTNRVVEIMVAAAKPRALMMGKILGVGAVGLVQIAVWVGMALVTMTYKAEILGVFGIHAGGWSLPPMGLDVVAVVLSYFVLGYFFYAALFAAIGAMVSSEQEAQQAQTPVMMLLIVPMMCITLVSNDPRGGAAEVLTMIPFSSPILMPMRYVLDGASGAGVVVSLAILAASTWVVAWLAGRIYRVGILLYGKRPSLRELGRWIKYG
ncbi:MAG: ABC transporter permease, partial [Myxococcales bacterium]|nr:ABC transporter permease [Myxococcales bacterium]